jgi:AraC family transcriptional regulator
MDKIDRKRGAQLLASHVADSRYFFLDLSPVSRAPLAVALGGWEVCRPEYRMERATYPFHVLEYVVSGLGTVRLAGRSFEARAGTLFACAPTMPCEIRTDPTAPLAKFFFCLKGVDAARRLKGAGVPVGKAVHASAHGELRSLAEDLVREGQRSGSSAKEICRHLCEVLLLKTAELVGGRHDERSRSRLNFDRCKALIDANAARMISLQDIAAAAGLEASSVCRVFRRYQGTSPYQYLLRRKMNIAAEHLLERGGLVKEAAAHVGIADPFHFSRLFRAVHGVAPSALLAAQR